MTALVDTDLLHDQFDGLPPDVLAQIRVAFAADMMRESAALVAATVARDPYTASRARHALDGLCGHFGAGLVMDLARGPLHDTAGRNAFEMAVARTVAAVDAALQ
jgi:hypothetical protein